MPNQGRWRLPSGRRARTYGAIAAASAVALTSATAVALGGEGSGSAADRSVHTSFGGGPAPAIGKVRELPELRTSRSRTVDLGDGTYEVRVSNEPVNFRGRDGRWRAIDNRLRAAADGTFTTTANPFAVTLPADASQPVTVEHGGRELAFALTGASAASEAETDGSAATYDEVVDGVDVSYEARGGSLKETLTLASADAPTSYSFATDAPGLRPRLLRSGGVGFFDAGDRRRFTFAPPWMKDAAGALSRAVRYALVERGGGDVVELRIDASWLNDPARRFPVDVDPTVWAAPEGTCQLTSGFAANVDDCGVDGPVWVGRYGSAVHRAVVMVDPRDVVPPGTVLLQGQLDSLNEAQSADEDTTLELFGLTREFGPEATWNEADDGEPWTTPGGDVGPAALHRRALGRTEVGNWIGLALPRLAQAQLDETTPVNGLLVKQADESRQHVNILDTFTLKLRYHWRTGIDDPAYSLDRTALTGTSRMDVNVGNGNLFASSDDLPFGDYEGRLPLRRVWNAQVSGPFDGTYGVPSRGDYTTIALERNWIDDSMALYGPGATDGLFVKRADGSYEPPSGLPATLAPNGDGTWTLTFDDSGEVWRFGAVSGDRYWLESAEDPFGKVITVDYDDATVSDSDGRFERSTVGPDGNITRSIDQDGAVDTYTYEDSDLVSYRDPAGAITRYTLDPQERIERIDLPDRRAVELDYDSDWRVTAVTPVATDGRAGTPTTYTYANGVPLRTTRTEPGGRQTVYTFDNGLLATEIAAGATPPALTLSGGLWDARGTTVTRPLTLSWSASDASGIQSVRVLVSDEAGEWENDCSTSCGGSTGSWALDPEEYSGGELIVRIVATDAVGDTRAKAFRVTVPPGLEAPDGMLPGESEPDDRYLTPFDHTDCELRFSDDTTLCYGDPADADLLEEPITPFSSSTRTLQYGIAQDGGQIAFLASPVFTGLRIRRVRRLVAWNTMDHRSLVDEFAAFARAARGRQIMVTFNFGCRDPSAGSCYNQTNYDWLPRPEVWVDAVKRFQREFPMVRYFGAWNEPNHLHQPTRLIRDPPPGGGPKRAALYTKYLSKFVCKPTWDAIRRAVADGRPALADRLRGNTCEVVAGEFHQDGGPWKSYARTFAQELKRLHDNDARAGPLPKYWGLHPYKEIRLMRDPRKGATAAYLPIVRRVVPSAKIWFTEAGSRVDSLDWDASRRRNTESQQAEEVRWLYNTLATEFDAVQRVYYYSLCGPEGLYDAEADWDSSLLGAMDLRRTDRACVDQTRRTAWTTLQGYSRDGS